MGCGSFSAATAKTNGMNLWVRAGRSIARLAKAWIFIASAKKKYEFQRDTKRNNE
jgi:hypothetical protein